MRARALETVQPWLPRPLLPKLTPGPKSVLLIVRQLWEPTPVGPTWRVRWQLISMERKLLLFSPGWGEGEGGVFELEQGEVVAGVEQGEGFAGGADAADAGAGWGELGRVRVGFGRRGEGGARGRGGRGAGACALLEHRGVSCRTGAPRGRRSLRDLRRLRVALSSGASKTCAEHRSVHAKPM